MPAAREEVGTPATRMAGLHRESRDCGAPFLHIRDPHPAMAANPQVSHRRCSHLHIAMPLNRHRLQPCCCFRCCQASQTPPSPAHQHCTRSSCKDIAVVRCRAASFGHASAPLARRQLTTNGNSSGEGIRGVRARSARAPCPTSRRLGPPTFRTSLTEKGGKLQGGRQATGGMNEAASSQRRCMYHPRCSQSGGACHIPTTTVGMAQRGHGAVHHSRAATMTCL